MKEKKNKNVRKLKSGILTSKIMQVFEQNQSKRYNAKQLIKKLNILNHPDAVQLVLKQLAEKKLIAQLTYGKYKFLKSDKSTQRKSSKIKTKDSKYVNYKGIVDMTRSGDAFIVVEGLEKDIFIANKNLAGALNGDEVKVRARINNSRGKPTGKVIEIVKRAQNKFIGTLRKGRHKPYVQINHKGYSFNVDTFEHMIEDMENGSKVKLSIKSSERKSGNLYVAETIDSLHYNSTNDVAMMEILYNNGFAQEFPEEVETAAKQLKMEITDATLKYRRDFRNILTMTIDPDTAKDFDDAISFEKLENGQFEIGIHIADVTHFLRPGSVIDKEAYDRSTSVYLVDRVAPMLPEVLSNDLCSLNPNEDKFCFSASFVFSKDFTILKKWFGKTIIHSDRRFSYEEAQERIESGKGDYADEIQFLNKVAHHLRDKRFSEGAITFETEELKFKLDEHGKPLDVYVKERKDAHMMIEDFMLLANREVAFYIHQHAKGQEIPFVYRIHDQPDPERLREFGAFAAELGLKMTFDTPQQVADSFNALAKKAEEVDAFKILEPLAIRTMAKAVYSTENIGHYGLGFEYYAHFTSPIRRYADVLVHRILFDNLEAIKRYDKGTLETQSLYISAQERKAVDAERESIKYKQVEWAVEHIGEPFIGLVSGIIDRGIFVTLENSLVEGMITFDQFPETYNVESRLRAIGKRTGHVLKIGDRISIQIESTDLDKRQIELGLVSLLFDEEE